MNKIIINNKTKLNDEEALKLVLSVIAKGRISGNGKCYCYASGFRTSRNFSKNEIFVYAEKRKNDIFTIVDNREN